MKIKIRKRITEKRQFDFSSATKLETEFSKLLKKSQDPRIEQIFNKKLIFYDLETSGLERDKYSMKDVGDQIHQIAALVYDLRNDNNDSIEKNRAEKPDNQFVAKIEWREDVIEKRSLHSYLRYLDFTELMNSSYCKKFAIKKSKFEDEHFEITENKDIQRIINKRNDLIAKVTKRGKTRKSAGEEGVNFLNLQKSSKNGKYYYVFKDSSKEDNTGATVDQLSLPFSNTKNNKIATKTESIGTYYNKILSDYDKIIAMTSKEAKKQGKELKKWKSSNAKYSQGFFTHLMLQCRENKYSALRSLFEDYGKSINKPTYFNLALLNEEESINFANIYLDSNFESFVINREGSNPPILDTLKKIKNRIGTTVAENKAFTKYDEFPKETYKPLSVNKKNANGDLLPMDEKEALIKFFEFLDNEGENEYILIGQNINSFDNPFVVRRSKLHGINKTDYQKFTNSFVYDTKLLFQSFIDYLKVFQQLYSTVAADPSLQGLTDLGAMDEINKEITKILANLTLDGVPKAKLQTLMKAFVSEDAEQTHTADDDCEKLAQVMFPLVAKYKEIYNKINKFVIDAKNELYDTDISKFPDYIKYKSQTKNKDNEPGKSTLDKWQKKITGKEEVYFNELLKKLANKIFEDYKTQLSLPKEKELSSYNKSQIDSQKSKIKKLFNNEQETEKLGLTKEEQKVLKNPTTNYKKAVKQDEGELFLSHFLSAIKKISNLDVKKSYKFATAAKVDVINEIKTNKMIKVRIKK